MPFLAISLAPPYPKQIDSIWWRPDEKSSDS
jgi:hypothetical protein